MHFSTMWVIVIKINTIHDDNIQHVATSWSYSSNAVVYCPEWPFPQMHPSLPFLFVNHLCFLHLRLIGFVDFTVWTILSVSWTRLSFSSWKQEWSTAQAAKQEKLKSTDYTKYSCVLISACVRFLVRSIYWVTNTPPAVKVSTFWLVSTASKDCLRVKTFF